MNGTRQPAHDAAAVEATLRLSVGRSVRKGRQTKGSTATVPLSEESVPARPDQDEPGSPGTPAVLEGARPPARPITLAALEQSGPMNRAREPAHGRRAVTTITKAGRRAGSDQRSPTVRRLAVERKLTAAGHSELHTVLPSLDRLWERP
ncbi:MarR family transcriptional regulator [Kitasatospora sp. GP82]|uniref:MarR family transcriptional regulator n=1 Tax=Kitasatospora sp. GP82 TaxID=3035089 RepID=UPI0024767151|nr:MarR family transcriptional regulator [Kitasatospora sp. GP82]MDH6129488.1 hypothetical protein [Kitasatospora sp. GP82]